MKPYKPFHKRFNYKIATLRDRYGYCYWWHRQLVGRIHIIKAVLIPLSLFFDFRWDTPFHTHRRPLSDKGFHDMMAWRSFRLAAVK